MTYNTYAQDLKDVGNYLRGNLSPASLSSASDLVAKADGESKQVMKHLDAIVSAVDKIASATGETAPSTQPGAVAPMAK